MGPIFSKVACYYRLATLLKTNAITSYFSKLLTTSYMLSHLFAEQLLLQSTIRKLFLCLKNLGKFSGKDLESERFQLPIINCTKKLHCGSENSSKCLQYLSGTVPLEISFTSCFRCFCWLFKALNVMFVQHCKQSINYEL